MYHFQKCKYRQYSKGIKRNRQIDIVKSTRQILRGGNSKRFVIPFECKPFSKSIAEITKSLAVGNNSISINGTGKTYPIIDIQGTGTFKITMGNKIINLKDISGNIRIDNELMNATSIDGLTNLNNKMSGEFINLEKGTNLIVVEKVSGTLTSIKMEYQEAWL